MTVRPALVAAALLPLCAAAVSAQSEAPQARSQRQATQTPAPAPATTPTPPALQPPRREGQPVNVKVELTIVDQRGGAAPSLKKTVTVVTGDQMSGFIRSQANYVTLGVVPLNVDAEPAILADGKIRLRLNLQYTLPASNQPSNEAGSLRTTEIHENLSLILENGKPMVAAQSADPVGDRQVTIEVKATVLR
jgi:hypothetical protein